MKHALVTGASDGIGKEIAIQLAEKGYHVFAISRNNKKLESIKTHFPNIHPVTADIATTAGLEAVIKACGGKPLDYVVHSAAVLEPFGTLSDVQKNNKAEYDYHIATNVTAPLALTKSLSSQLKDGRVLFLGSYFAHKSAEELTPWAKCFGAYCASKSALHAEVVTLQPELSKTGITALYAIPGSVNTALFQRFWQEAQQSKVPVHPSTPITAKESAAFTLKVLASPTPSPASPLKIWDYNKDLLPAINPTSRIAQIVAQGTAANADTWRIAVAKPSLVARSRL